MTFVVGGFFMINSKFKVFFGQTGHAISIKFGVHTQFGELNSIIILPVLEIGSDLYYA